MLAMVAVLCGVSWMSFTTPVASDRPPEQDILFSQVPTALDPNSPPPLAAPAEAEGTALAYLDIPRFGPNWMWTVVEGIADEALAKGPGHYPGTALPGGEGNVVISGHRSGHGDPFIDFDLLELGDEITLRQSGAWWTYRIINAPKVIESTTRWVLNQPAHKRKLTLTTCWPKYGNEKRMFVRAELVDWSGK